MGTSAYNKYPPEYAFEGKTVLNIGCGYATYKASNVINLDAYGTPQILWDLGDPRPLPLPDNSVDFVLANHILEHVPNWWHCFEECARVLKIGGRMEVWVPGMGSDSVLGYRDHINTINQCSWWGIRNFIENPNNAWAAANRNGGAMDMQLISVTPKIDRDLKWIKWIPKSLYPWIAAHLRNTVKEIGFNFEKMPPLESVNFQKDTVEALL